MTKRLSENARRHVGETVTIRWGVSRAQNSYGYTTCSLRNHHGKRVAACNGGGYDLKGTVIGAWVATTFPKELNKLPLNAFPKRSHFERAEHPRRVCRNTMCIVERIEAGAAAESEEAMPYLPHDCEKCPKCGSETEIDHNDGRVVDDGRGLYSLTFHDPNYDPGKAVIGKDCHDRTLGTSEGETVAEAEAAGKSLGLERYQAVYAASSPTPTKRHTVPSIDGACGVSCVLNILRAIGLDLHQVASTSKLDVYTIVKAV